MRDVVRLGTVCCAIGIIASMGGYEHGQFGLVGMFGRMAIFAAVTGVGVVLDEVLTQRKKARVRSRASTTAVCEAIEWFVRRTKQEFVLATVTVPQKRSKAE